MVRQLPHLEDSFIFSFLMSSVRADNSLCILSISFPSRHSFSGLGVTSFASPSLALPKWRTSNFWDLSNTGSLNVMGEWGLCVGWDALSLYWWRGLGPFCCLLYNQKLLWSVELTGISLSSESIVAGNNTVSSSSLSVFRWNHIWIIKLVICFKPTHYLNHSRITNSPRHFLMMYQQQTY